MVCTNGVILPRTKLEARTIETAGSMVTKCLPEYYCVIECTSTKIIRYFDKEKYVLAE